MSDVTKINKESGEYWKLTADKKSEVNKGARVGAGMRVARKPFEIYAAEEFHEKLNTAWSEIKDNLQENRDSSEMNALASIYERHIAKMEHASGGLHEVPREAFVAICETTQSRLQEFGAQLPNNLESKAAPIIEGLIKQAKAQGMKMGRRARSM